MRSLLTAATLLLLVACTPGSSAAPGSGSVPAGAQTVTVDVNLTQNPTGTTSAGTAGGYRPLTTSLAVGNYVQFVNSDGFSHTSTSMPGTTYPASYPFSNSALNASGATLSGGFSTGNLMPGATSSAFLADRAGTYLYGCFYHYGTPMRAEIDVR